MNEEFFNQLYLETGMKEAGVSESQYSELLLNNEELRISTYGELGFDKEGVSMEDFDSLLGLKKKESTASTSSAGESPSKKDFDFKENPTEEDLKEFDKYIEENRFTPAEVNPLADTKQSFDGGAFLQEQEEKQKKANEKFSKVDFNENFKGIDPLDSPEIEPSKSDAFTGIQEDVKEDLKRVVEQKERAELEASPEYKKGLSEDLKQIESKELKGVDYLTILDEEEYTDNLDLKKYNFANSNSLNKFINNKRKEALKKIGSDQGIKTRSNYATDFRNADPSFTEKDIAEMVDSKELSDINIFGVKKLGLDEEEEKEYKKDILRFAELRQNKNKTTVENLEQAALSKKVAELREDQDKQFINPETGKIDGAVKKEVTEKAKLYSKNLKTKSDYLKFLDKYKEEYHNIKGIEKDLKRALGKDEIPSKFSYDADRSGYFSPTDNEKIMTYYALLGEDAAKLVESNLKNKSNKIENLYAGLQTSEKNFMALNRALLLNEDPAAVSRGFKMLEGIPFLEGLGEIVVAGGESLAETVTGDEILTDTDYVKAIVELANETGVKLTEEQYERSKLDFTEKLGGAIGTSLPMMAEIAFNVLVTKNVAAGLKIPEYLSKIEYLQKSPKLVKFIGGAMEATTQAIAFEFAEGGSLAMGAGEYYGGKTGEKLVSAITKGKGGKFIAFMGKVLGAGTAGTAEEYVGNFVDEGFKQGFFTKEQFENTFGRTYDEGLDKFLITAIMATAMAGGAEVGSFLQDTKGYYEKLGNTENVTVLEELIEANKKQDPSYKDPKTTSDSETTSDLETDLLSDQKKIKSAENKAKKRAAKDKAQEERAKKIEDKNLELKLNKEKSIGEETLAPLTEEVDIDGKTFLTTEGETKTEESIEEEITEPTQEQIQEDIANNDFATFKYEDESSVPKELKEYISSKGSTQVGRGSSKKKSVNVTVPKSLANYLNSKAEASTEQSSETTTDTTTEGETDVNTLNQEEEIDIDVEEINEIRQKNNAKKESTLESNLDKPVSYKGEEGVLKQEGQQIVFESDTKIVELGNVEEVSSTPLSDIKDLAPIDVETKSETTTEEKLTPEETTTEKETTIKKELTHEGVDYTIQDHKVNKKGESVLTVKEVDTGLTRKLKGDVAEKGRVILEEAKAANTIKAEEARESKERVKQEEQEASDFNELLAEEEYNNKTAEELEIEEAKSKEEVAKFEEELTDVILQEQKAKKEKGLVISEGGKKFLVRQKADGTYSVAAIRSDGKAVAFTGKANVDTRNKLIERFKDKVSTAEDIALQEGDTLSEEYKQEQEDKILNFLDKAIKATSTKGRAFDATLGIPLTISNGALQVVKASYVTSKNLAEAIAAGMAHLKKMNYNVGETKFTDFVLDNLSGKKVTGKINQEDDKPGAKKPPVKGSKDFKKGRQEGKKEIKSLQDSFGEFVKGKTKEIKQLSPKLTATVLKKAALLKTEKGLASAKAYVEKVLSNKKFRVEEAARSNSLDFIGKALERKNWKKKGKNEGKISKESQEFLQKAAVASKLTKEQANEKREAILRKREGKELREEDIEDLQALTFAGLDEASQYDLDNATQLIKEYQKSGREQLRAKLESIKAEDKRVSKVLLNAVTNFGKKKIEKAEVKDSFSLTTAEKLSPEQWFGLRPAINYLTGMTLSINQINSRNAGFSDLLDIINNTSSSSVKGGATEAKTILEAEFYRPLKQARLNLLTGTRRKLDKVKNAKIEIFGKKESFNKLSTTERIADINSNIKEKAEKNLKESGVELDNETLKIEVQNLEVELQSNADFIGVDTSKPGWKGGLTEKSLARIETINEARRSLYEEELAKLNDESYPGGRKISKKEIIKRADEIIADKAKTYKISSEEKSSLEAADKILETTHVLLNKKGEELRNSKLEKLKITNDEAITIYNWSKNPEYAKVLDSMSNEVSLEGKKNKNYSPESEAKIKKAMELVENNPKLKAYADFTIDFYKEYHPEISDSHMEFYNLGLTQVENHTPGKRVDIDVQEDLKLTSNSKNIASTRNGSLLDRQNSMKPLDLSVGSSQTMKKYIEQMEHFIHMTPIAKKLTKGLKSPEAKNAISQTTGNYMNTILGKHIDDIILGEAGMKSDGFESFNKLRGNVTTAALALKATLYPKQLTSAIAYAAETDTGAWLQEQAKFLTEDFTEDRKMIWNSDFIQNRLGKGYDIEVSNAIHQQGDYNKLRSKLTNALMTPTKYGDIHAIMGGGVAFYRVKKKEYLKQGMSKAKAEKEAFLDFVIATSRAQQSSDIEETSHYQRGGKIAKTFTMFKTSPRQYYQKTSGSIRSVRKGRGSKRDLKRAAMFGGTLPLLFTLAATPLLAYRLLKRDPSDEDAEELASALVLSNVSGLAVTGDILKSVSDKVIRGKNFDYESITSLAVFQTALEKATEYAIYSFKEDGPSKDYKDGEVITDLAIPLLAVSTGFPAEELIKNVKKITSGQLRRVVSGKASKEEMLSLLGYSDYSLGIDKKKTKKKKSPAQIRFENRKNKKKKSPAQIRFEKRKNN